MQPINTTHSRGATDVRNQIASYLETAVPALLVKYRAAYGLADSLLPDPVDYRAYEPTGLDRWPLLGALVSHTKDWARLDYDGVGAEMYQARYEMQLFLWVRTPQNVDGTWAEPEYNECLRLRDDLGAVIRMAMLSDPTFGTETMTMQEDTLTEDFSEATQVKGGRWISGLTWNFDLSYAEAIVVDPLGTVETFGVTAEHHAAAMPQ